MERETEKQQEEENMKENLVVGSKSHSKDVARNAVQASLPGSSVDSSIPSTIMETPLLGADNVGSPRALSFSCIMTIIFGGWRVLAGNEADGVGGGAEVLAELQMVIS